MQMAQIQTKWRDLIDLGEPTQKLLDFDHPSDPKAYINQGLYIGLYMVHECVR